MVLSNKRKIKNKKPSKQNKEEINRLNSNVNYKETIFLEKNKIKNRNINLKVREIFKIFKIRITIQGSQYNDS